MDQESRGAFAKLLNWAPLSIEIDIQEGY